MSVEFETAVSAATLDSLTRLPSRSSIEDRLASILLEQHPAPVTDHKPMAVLILGLDGFTYVNELLGYKAGDRLLQETAQRITAVVGGQELVGRWSGDEFILLLPDIEPSEEMCSLTGQLERLLAHTFELDGRNVFVTASIGISFYPKHGTDSETLVHHAELALRRAKWLGKSNFQYFTPELRAARAERLDLERELHNALACGQFLLHYQPIIDVQTGRMTGMEALLRWNHPEFGVVPPSRFIPIAEETGLIVPIGEWVLRTVCAQNRAWQDAGLPKVTIGVNMSMRQVQMQQFVQRVEYILSETSLEPQYLELEITESLSMFQVENVNAKIRELRRLGVRLSIDDFGTGYSSFAYLRRFPVNTLKIDRSFVDDIITNNGQCGILEAMLTMAHSLGIQVVAEGVEQPEQLEYLRERGCAKVQGYLFSRPVPKEEIEHMLAFGL